MKNVTSRRIAAFATALVAGASLAACSVETTDEADNATEAYETNVDAVIDEANLIQPDFGEPDMTNFVEPAPAPSLAPVPAKTPEPLTLDDETLDDAAATGMTSRVDRTGPAPKATGTPAQ